MTEKISVPSPTGKPKTCPECSGRGWVDNRCITPDHAHRCAYCDGRGRDALEHECYACHGTGLIEVRKEDKNPCPLCSGAGIYPVPEFMTAGDFAFNPSKRH
jgi:RecJ-like exonuclease